jgi:hypothetical protein
VKRRRRAGLEFSRKQKQGKTNDNQKENNRDGSSEGRENIG